MDTIYIPHNLEGVIWDLPGSLISEEQVIAVVWSTLDRIAIALLEQKGPDGAFGLLQQIEIELWDHARLLENPVLQEKLQSVRRALLHFIYWNYRLSDEETEIYNVLFAISWPILHEASNADRANLKKAEEEKHQRELLNLLIAYDIESGLPWLVKIDYNTYEWYKNDIITIFEDHDLKEFCRKFVESYNNPNTHSANFALDLLSDPRIDGANKMKQSEKRLETRIGEDDMQAHIKWFRERHETNIRKLLSIDKNAYYTLPTPEGLGTITSRPEFLKYARTQCYLPQVPTWANYIFSNRSIFYNILHNLERITYRSILIWKLKWGILDKPPISIDSLGGYI